MHHGTVSPEIAKGLLALRQRIEAAKIPASRLDESINVAIWNIREFGKSPRGEAAIHYIAEILNQFDLIALVELRNDLGDLGRVLTYLGRSWDVVYSDWMDDAGGNGERVAYLYDRRAVTFCGLAAEIGPPRTKSGDEFLSQLSFWRAPYMCAFRSGNFDFVSIAAHARWGDKVSARKAELAMLAQWIDTRFKSRFVEDHDLLVMGDFNTPALGDTVFKALTSLGLQMPDALKELKMGDQVVGGSNLGRDARYDQILHLPTAANRFSNRGGTLDFYGSPAEAKLLFPDIETPEKFSFQLSDHFPVWVQINVDIDGDRLQQIVQNDPR